MEREALVRAHRRRQALEAIGDEQGRERALTDERDTLIVELEAETVDAPVFAELTDHELEIVHGALGIMVDEPEEDDELVNYIVFDEPDDEETPAEARARIEEEIARLEEELVASRERQAALARYVELLDRSIGPETAG
jgi:hypothetical protein